MKISNSKKELARIISESGGWCDGAQFSAQDKDGEVFHYATKPSIDKGSEVWGHKGCIGYGEFEAQTLQNWHQTILSRDEYFHLYPASDADGWIEWKGGECPVEKGTLVDVIWRDGTERAGVKALHLGGAGHQFWVADGMSNDIIAYRLHKPEQAKPESGQVEEAKPTIEQLAADYRNAKDYADRKHKEADAARGEADAALERLYQAGLEIGIDIAIASDECESEPELVITDWRDLLNGDMVVITGSDNPGWKSLENQELEVRIEGDSCEDVYFGSWCMSNNTEWLFIRRQ